uniref:BCNT-C domain-containing protein n=1 Tax=Arcella intermedia TaxID=1963864 RepID=A0A6B2LF65_9EUKA
MTRKRTREERDKQEEKVETPQSLAKKAKAFQDADAIWAEMKGTTKKPEAATAPTSGGDIGWNLLQKKVTKTNERVATPMPKKETTKGASSSALSALFPAEPKDNKSMEDLWAEFNEGKYVAPTTTQLDQTFSFAGENIRVGATVDTQETSTKKGTNLADLVSNLTAQPKKLSTVQKSSMDWSQFKNEKGIVEELEQAKKDGYLEKQAFLQRSDLRKYENEKNLRNKERARKKEL